MNTKKRMDRCFHRPATRIVSLILSLAMLVTLTAGLDLSAFAWENYTSGDYEYSIRQDGMVEIVGYTGNDVVLNIPSTINNRKVYSLHFGTDNYTVKKINIANGIVYFDVSGFYNVEEINIPASVGPMYDDEYFEDYDNSLESNAVFYQCYSLKTINVDINNKYLSSEDGVLFDKDKTILLRYPSSKQNKKYIVPGTVKRLYNACFDECKYLENVVCQNGLTEIYAGAFFFL